VGDTFTLLAHEKAVSLFDDNFSRYFWAQHPHQIQVLTILDRCHKC